MRFSPPVGALTLLALSGDLFANESVRQISRNDIPSCRATFFHEHNSEPERDFIIVVDRTITLSKPLALDTVKKISRAIRPGDHLEVISFSGVSKTEFTVVQFDGQLDAIAQESELENKMPAPQIVAAEKCFKNQPEYGRQKIEEQVNALLSAPLSDAQRSEILRALTSISQQVVGGSRAHDKVVVIISDMLEFSDIASFYANRKLRAIDPKRTLEAARSANLIGTFDNAKIYVAGTASPSNLSEPAPGLRERNLLQEFWEIWFRESGGTVIGLDNPALLHEIE